MASTKVTIRTNLPLAASAALGAVFAFLGAANLFGSLTPAHDLNAQIDDRLTRAASLPTAARLVQFNDLKQQQEKALLREPAEPYAWSRLSYLRLVTGDNRYDAFKALRLSDLTSPYEIHQMPERALMWFRFQDVESPQQKDYQDTLWLKAAHFEPKITWEIAHGNGLTHVVGETLKRKDPILYQQWKPLEDTKPKGFSP